MSPQPPGILIYRMMVSTHPTNLGRTSRSQSSVPTLFTCTGGRYNGAIACGAASTQCSPHEYRLARRRKKLLGNIKERRGYSHLKEEALDRSMWGSHFGRGFGPVVKQTIK